MGENTFGGPTILDCCTAKRAPVQPKLPHSRPPTAYAAVTSFSTTPCSVNFARQS